MAAATIFALATPPAFAESRAAQPETAEAPSAAQQAQALFKEGATLYKMSDYTGALDKFTSAFKYSAQIEDDDLRGRVLHALQFNLARAHVKTYRLDKDLLHLRQAVDLLEKYLADGAQLGIELEAEALMAQAKAELARQEEKAEETAKSAVAPSETPTGESPGSPGAVDDGGKPGKALTLAGYSSIGVATVGLGLMVGGIVMGSSADKEDAAADTAAELQAAERRGKLGNALTVAGAATAGVFAAAGVTLVVLGKRGARRGGRTAGIWVSPSATATFTGLRLGGSF